jgi:hypothetical protein
MKKISIIGSENNQVMKFIIPENGRYINVLLLFKEQQQGWFLSFDYQDFSVKNLRVVTSGNFLHQFKNLIPFGLSCEVDANQEPMLSDDFKSGRARLFLLSADEVIAFSEVLSGQASA